MTHEIFYTDVVLIELTQNKVAMIDIGDAEKVMQFKWYTHKCGEKRIQFRALTRPWIKSEKKYVTVYMHRFIMDAPPGMKVDHINGNGLDNRRENLRICTHSENNFNKRKPIKDNPVSRYKGVFWNKKCSKWVAKVRKNNVTKHAGYYDCEREAALAYNKKALELHGDFANLNIVDCEK